MRFIREQGDFCIGVAGFPEGHIACKEGKLGGLAAPQGEGRCRRGLRAHAAVLRQRGLLRVPATYLTAAGRERAHCAGHGADPERTQIKRFTALCGASIPAPLAAELEAPGDDAAVRQFGIDYATRQCEELLREGVPGLHFYTLNKARSTTAVVRNLSLERRVSGEAAVI